MTLSWADLAARTLVRQFPEPPEPTAAGVITMVERTGPIQSQTARSPFVGLAARMPGVTHAAVTEAYEAFGIVRGSTLRGTVHTCVAADHPLLEVATRLGLRTMWSRALRLVDAELEQVWAGIEDFATDAWRTPEELSRHVRDWLATHDPEAVPRFAGTSERYFGFGHGGLLRRPLKGAWSGQGAPGYRSAAALLGDRSAVLADPEAAMAALVRRHLASYGPASRNDLAWWSGAGLRAVDAALERLDLPAEEGPDGRRYHDLPDAPPPASGVGVRLLPEFDALLCAFDPPARERFVAPAHYDILWRQENGMLLAPILIDDRLGGYWRLAGQGKRRGLQVWSLPGVRSLTEAELAGPRDALERALDVRIEQLTVGRHQR